MPLEELFKGNDFAMDFFLEPFNFNELAVGFFIKLKISFQLAAVFLVLTIFSYVAFNFGFIGGHKKENTNKNGFQGNSKSESFNAKVKDEPKAKPKTVKDDGQPAAEEMGDEIGDFTAEFSGFLFDFNERW